MSDLVQVAVRRVPAVVGLTSFINALDAAANGAAAQYDTQVHEQLQHPI